MREHLSSHAVGDNDGRRERARIEARKIVANQNPNGGLRMRPGSGPAAMRSYWQPSGPGYRGSVDQADHAATALRSGTPEPVVRERVSRGCDPRRRCCRGRRCV